MLAMGLRIFRIDQLGLEHDEVAHWIINRAILDDGKHGIYFTEAYGHEAGYHYLQAGFLALLGDSIFALRFISVLLGVVAVAVACAVGRTLYNRSVG